MDKMTFLEELRKSLRVLKDEEIQDIISEYEQHIDLKVEKGLTVEQAIADFGNVKELAAEILEGYHVKAEFEITEEVTESKKNLLTAGSGVLKNSVRNIWSWIQKFWIWIVNGFLWCGKQTVRPFVWMRSKWNREGKVQQEVIVRPKTSNHLKEWLVHKRKGFGTMMLRLWNWLVRVSLCCLRIGWNCFVVGIALTIGGFGLMSLFAVGVLGVLVFQGYPIIGVTVGCLGLVLCLFAATVFVWTLIWHAPKVEIDKEEKTETEMTDLTEMEEGQHA